MARKTKKKGQRKEDYKSQPDESRRDLGEQTAPLSLIEAVQTIAAYNARADLGDEYQLLLFLKSWWSKTYNRPLKDPILLSYTLHELLYEFYDRIERKQAEEERSNQVNDKIESEKEKADLDWAEEEERRELERERSKKKSKSKKVKDDAAKSSNPADDPENIKWMQEQLEKAKQIHGDTFGEDIEETFE